MKILCIDIPEYIRKNILKFNDSNIEYDFIDEKNFLKTKFIDNLEEFSNYATILIGIDYDVKDELNLQKYADILANIIYVISKSNIMKKIVFISSYSVYKEKLNNEAYSEEDMIEPQDYKSSLYYYYECMLRNVCQNYNKQLIIVRAFNVFGLYQKDDFIITYLINEILSDKSELYIGDMRKRRDYVYIKDLIAFLNLVINENIEKKAVVYNLGMGVSYTIKEILGMIKEITKKDKKVIFNPSKIRIVSDYNDVKADITKIKTELNFEFQYSIYEALTNFIELFKVNKEK